MLLRMMLPAQQALYWAPAELMAVWTSQISYSR